ncbi:NAD-dependent epimerase/dehydratase family protein [Taklimakanibacter lacteus]|uniref:NAD-dependent epimerase/dehydratase family protein n=1 Tax=Taklimakanibacter lacteus TaxID=2268456 RepID=UPI000E661F64
MGYRIFLAGASGVIGRRLVPLLIEAGHHVTGIGRTPRSGDAVRAMGAFYIAVDVFNADGLRDAMITARPQIVIHQLTDLPEALDPALMNEAILRNARIRDEGTRNLVAGARAAGTRRIIAQSIAWAYAPGQPPYAESDPLDIDAQGSRATTLRGIARLEGQVLNARNLAGIVLRYGQLYGPDTGRDVPAGASPLHVDAAAHAAFCALDRGDPGIFNIAEAEGEVIIRKAIDGLGWRADFRLSEEKMKVRA